MTKGQTKVIADKISTFSFPKYSSLVRGALLPLLQSVFDMKDSVVNPPD